MDTGGSDSRNNQPQRVVQGKQGEGQNFKLSRAIVFINNQRKEVENALIVITCSARGGRPQTIQEKTKKGWKPIP